MTVPRVRLISADGKSVMFQQVGDFNPPNGPTRPARSRPTST